jgi:histidinol-phosphatase (PHP family)
LPERFDQSPLATRGLFDYHVHPDFSVDACGTVDEYCERALRRGLSGLCFTSHFDSNPDSDGRANRVKVDGEILPATVANMRPYVEAVLAGREKYAARGLRVLLGVEFGWYPRCEPVAEHLLNTYEFDYALCGIHELENICLCSGHRISRCYSRYDSIEFVRRYFREARSAAMTGLFHTLAHIPYYLRYAPGFYGEGMLTHHVPHIDSLLEACLRTDTELEINTSGIRHGSGYYYPIESIIGVARTAGVRVRRLGSDAHHPDHLALDFDNAVRFLKPMPPVALS